MHLGSVTPCTVAKLVKFTHSSEMTTSIYLFTVHLQIPHGRIATDHRKTVEEYFALLSVSISGQLRLLTFESLRLKYKLLTEYMLCVFSHAALHQLVSYCSMVSHINVCACFTSWCLCFRLQKCLDIHRFSRILSTACSHLPFSERKRPNAPVVQRVKLSPWNHF